MAVGSDTFIRQLRIAREEAGLSQTELARRMSERLPKGIDGTAITRMESGGRMVRLDDAIAAADVLGVPLASLINEPVGALESRMDELRYELSNAEKAVENAASELERRQVVANDLQEELDDLQRQIDDLDREEIERDAEDWRRSNLGL